MERQFYAELWKNLSSIGSNGQGRIEFLIRARLRELENEFADQDADRTTRYHLQFATLVLSAYESLTSSDIEETIALAALKEVVVKPNSWTIKAAAVVRSPSKN